MSVPLGGASLGVVSVDKVHMACCADWHMCVQLQAGRVCAC
jgi:hypothetical protein